MKFKMEFSVAAADKGEHFSEIGQTKHRMSEIAENQTKKAST